MLSLLAAPALALYGLIFSSSPGRYATRELHDPLAANVPEVPSSLIDVLAVPVNVEGTCHPTTRAGWTHEASECSYSMAGRSWTITTATPSPERVARWIVDASSMIASVSALRARDHAAWEDALVVMARHTIEQSGRVFPLDGVVWEDFEGPTGYVFHDGITYGTYGGPLASCRACACRIDSLHRSQWCTYASEVLGKQSYASCLSDLGGETGWNDAWAERCLENHHAAWNDDKNESYRAIAYFVERHRMAPAFPDPSKPDPRLVVEALVRAYANPYGMRSIADP